MEDRQEGKKWRGRVLHVNFSDSGGAGNAARRSHLALLAAGVDSKMLVAKKISEAAEVYQLRYTFLRKLWRVIQLKYDAWLKRKVDPLDKSLRSANRLPGFTLDEIERFQPDIVHLHWVNAGMLSLKEIQRIDTPVVWTLHDLWPVNGSCHYAGSLMTEGMASQYPTTFEDVDTSQYSNVVGALNRKCLRTKPNGIVTLCRNFYKVVDASHWLPHQVVETIPNCLDLSTFCPVECKSDLRAEYSLPEGKILLLYCAASLHARHKGMDLLLASLELLDLEISNRCCLVVVGGDSGVEKVGAMKCYSLGSIYDEGKMARVYQACDMFLCPSREDNFPNTVAEASACGLPVVAFHTGGLPDMIDHGKTGYLAEPYSIDDYAEGVELAVENYREWSPVAERKAKGLYDPKIHADSLASFYQNLLASE